MARPVSESQSLGKMTGKGIKVYKGKIVSCENISGVPFKSGFIPDVGVKLEIEVGYDKPLPLMIFGKFNVEDGVIKGYVAGGASSIIKYLSRTLGNNAQVGDDWSLLPDVLKATIGKEIYLLRYTKDVYHKPDTNEAKIGWQTWDVIGKVSEEELTKEFLESVGRGFPKDYDETVIDQVNAEKGDEAATFDPNKFAKAQSDFDEEVESKSI